MPTVSSMARARIVLRVATRTALRLMTPANLLRGYAALAATAAIALLALLAAGRASVLDTIGVAPASGPLLIALIAALGACASALSFGPEPAQRGCTALAVGHVFIGMAIAVQHPMQPLPPAGVWVSLVTAAVLTYVNPVPPQGLRSEFRWFEGLRRPSTTSVDLAGLEAGRLRSAYETKIQETARQEERHRLARELHDAVKQQLFVIQTAAATAQVRLTADSAGARDALDQVRASARDSIAELEAMLDQLQATPLEQTGLVDTLRKQGDALELRTGVRVRFELGALPPGDTLAPGAGLAVLRVAQEALSNVGRHARASAVTIRYGWTDHRLELCVSDDGAGFDTTATTTGIGTRSMQARAAEFGGTLALTSAPGAGTQVTLSVPCDPLPALARSFRVQAVIWGCFVVGWFALFVAAMAQGDPVRNGYFWVWIVFPLLNFAAYLGAYHRSRRRQRALAR